MTYENASSTAKSANDVRRERDLAQIAAREMDPRYYDEFTPITKGPVYAIASLFFVGVAAAFHLALSLITRNKK